MVARNQWVKLSVVLLIALLARVALGAKNRPVMIDEVAVSRPLPVEVSFGPGIVAWTYSRATGNSSASGPVGNLGVLFGVSRELPLSLGLDMGFGRMELTSATNAAYIRLTPTAVYSFRSSANPDITPYVGLSVGPNLTVLNTYIADNKVADVSTYLEVLTRLGANIRLGSDLSLGLEAKLGVLDSYFLASPGVTLGMSL